MRLKVILFFSFCCWIIGLPLLCAESRSILTRDPLQITADETRVMDHGKIIHAKGNVHSIYKLENKDVLKSFSDEAIYEESSQLGLLKGHPRAFWQQGIGQLFTELKANTITLNLKTQEVTACGQVQIDQAENKILAQKLIFSQKENKFYSLDSRPQFFMREKDYKADVTCDQILAWTDKKQIQCLGKVQGLLWIQEKQP